MASENSDNADVPEESHGPRECMPCRGTGKLVSNLGGTPSTVTCPWCEGGGVRMPGIDSQAKWLGEQSGESSESEQSAPAE
jgi:DnaJ-class molecular chaperone